MTDTRLQGFDHPVNAVVQGASRGLGLAFVRQLLQRSNVEQILATCRAPDRADALQTLVEESSGRLSVARLDVTEEATIATAADQASTDLGHVHLLLNVAGLLHDERQGIAPEKKIGDVEPESVMQAFEVNSLGPLLVLKYFSKLIAPDCHTVVANLSARVGSITDNHLGGWYAYRASKAAQNMFTRTAAIELSRYRRTSHAICVALHPGTVDTELSRPFQTNVPDDQIFSPPRGARQLLDVIGTLNADDTGQFFDWAGNPVTW